MDQRTSQGESIGRRDVLVLAILALLAGWIFSVEAYAEVITRVSVATGGGQANDGSYYPSISADGRYVAFDSDASNLVPGDTNLATDVFVHDRQTGTTVRVSVSTGGIQGNGGSRYPASSADGRYVTFQSTASNLVPGDTNGKEDIFVHDRQTGTTTRVSVATGGAQLNFASMYASVSADGRYVAFATWDETMVNGRSGRFEVLVHDRQTGTSTSTNIDLTGEVGNLDSAYPSISADGWYVAFSAKNWPAFDYTNIFVHNLQSQSRSTNLVSNSLGGSRTNGHSWAPSISANGRYVVFNSDASNLVNDDTNEIDDVFVHDRQYKKTSRVSVNSDGRQATRYSSSQVRGDRTSISADGRYVAFESQARILDRGNQGYSVYVHDCQTRTTSLIQHYSRYPSISADGRYVAFASYEPRVIGDTNGKSDILVVDRMPPPSYASSLIPKAPVPPGVSQLPPGGQFQTLGARKVTLDIAVTDVSLDADCRIHVKYANTGTLGINQNLRQQAWIGSTLADDTSGPVNLAPRVSTERVLQKRLSGTAAVKAVIDADNKLLDANRANNTLTRTLTCTGKGGGK